MLPKWKRCEQRLSESSEKMNELQEIVYAYSIVLKDPQLHVPKFQDVPPLLMNSPSPREFQKPIGFWTSTLIDTPTGATSAWYEYAKKHYSDRIVPKGHVLHIHNYPRVFTTSGLKLFREWSIKTGRFVPDKYGSPLVYPWDILSRYVDAVHCRTFYETWPAESTVWMNSLYLKTMKCVTLSNK